MCIEICRMPAEVGRCDSSDSNSMKHWHFDDMRGTCISFIYSGCAGNLNNFLNIESCMDTCRDCKFQKHELFFSQHANIKHNMHRL